MHSRSVPAVAGLALVVAVCGVALVDDVAPPSNAAGDMVGIVEVVDDVDDFIGCANESVRIGGRTWYPVPPWGNERLARLHDEITAVERQPATGPMGLTEEAPRGSAGGVGTLYVYADGLAWYDSGAGRTIWLTQDALAYDWVC